MDKDNEIYDEMRDVITVGVPAAVRDFDFMQTMDVDEFSKALCKAQGMMTGAVKDSANPFFKSKYADLSAVWDDIRNPFAENGISVVQMPCGGGDQVSVVTQLTHTSGQWMRSKLTMIPTKKDPQGVGSAITYARRYALAGMAGVYQIDDDGNKASEQPQIAAAPIDEAKVKMSAKKAIELVDSDDEDYIRGKALAILKELSNDERIGMQAILKAAMVKGTKKTYFGAFKEHMTLERAALKEAKREFNSGGN